MTAPAIGFIGFGEAASCIARGLQREGITQLMAYDVNSGSPQLRAAMRQRADQSGTRLLPTLSDAIAASDIVFSAVTADVAQAVGKQAAPHLEARHAYVDLTSASPAVKQSISEAVTTRGAQFVEAAIMAAVPGPDHRVPMLVCGSGAQAFADRMRPYGMRLDVLEGAVGSASAVKMFRSIIIKGLEALMLECLLGAERYGAAERVFASVGESFPGLDWNQVAHYLVGRTALHGQRRAHEMEEVARTLSEMGIDPIMASAAARRLQWFADLQLTQRFDRHAPTTYDEVLRAIASVNGE